MSVYGIIPRLRCSSKPRAILPWPEENQHNVHKPTLLFLSQQYYTKIVVYKLNRVYINHYRVYLMIHISL